MPEPTQEGNAAGYVQSKKLRRGQKNSLGEGSVMFTE